MHLFGDKGHLAIGGHRLAKESWQVRAHGAHGERGANLAAEVPRASVAVRHNCHRHGSLRSWSDDALHGILVGESGALMGAASYARVGYFPAHRFTSATTTSLGSRPTKSSPRIVVGGQSCHRGNRRRVLAWGRCGYRSGHITEVPY